MSRSNHISRTHGQSLNQKSSPTGRGEASLSELTECWASSQMLLLMVPGARGPSDVRAMMQLRASYFSSVCVPEDADWGTPYPWTQQVVRWESSCFLYQAVLQPRWAASLSWAVSSRAFCGQWAFKEMWQDWVLFGGIGYIQEKGTRKLSSIPVVLSMPRCRECFSLSAFWHIS